MKKRIQKRGHPVCNRVSLRWKRILLRFVSIPKFNYTITVKICVVDSNLHGCHMAVQPYIVSLSHSRTQTSHPGAFHPCTKQRSQHLRSPTCLQARGTSCEWRPLTRPVASPPCITLLPRTRMAVSWVIYYLEIKHMKLLTDADVVAGNR